MLYLYSMLQNNQGIYRGIASREKCTAPIPSGRGGHRRGERARGRYTLYGKHCIPSSYPLITTAAQKSGVSVVFRRSLPQLIKVLQRHTHRGQPVCVALLRSRFKGALQLQLTAMVEFALLRYLSEFRLGVSSF